MENLVYRKKYFENLDGLRFVLATVVFSSHSQLGPAINSICDIEPIQKIVSVLTKGYFGVSFFFTLSGFLITYLILNEAEEHEHFNLKNFYIRRIVRIWPLYFTVLVFSFFVYPEIKTFLGYQDQNPFNLVYHLFFLSNFDSIRIHNLDLVGVAPMMININWSISIEEQFYLVWPVLFLLLPKRKFILAIIVVTLISLVFRQLIFTQGDGALYYHTLSVMSDLSMGALVAYACFYSAKFILLFEKMPRILIIAIYICGFLYLMYEDDLSGSKWFSDRIFNSIFFSFIIVEQSFSKKSFYKFSNFKTISSFGKYTYAIYMLHPIGIQCCIIMYRYLHIDRDEYIGFAFLYVLISYVITFGLSMLSYQLIEKKFLALRKKFY